MKLFHIVSLFYLIQRAVVADLPVHCLRHQIVGDWEFNLSPAKSERSSCGHHKPDDQDRQPPLSLLATLGPTTTLKLAVQDPDMVSSAKGDMGTWTMIYDEGWEVAIGGKVFFAFSKFKMVSDGKGGQTNVSHCDETLVGWYRDSTRTRWGCYHGKKLGSQATDAPASPPERSAKANMLDVSAVAGQDSQDAGASDDGSDKRASQEDDSSSGETVEVDDQDVPAASQKAAAPAADAAAPATEAVTQPSKTADAGAEVVDAVLNQVSEEVGNEDAGKASEASDDDSSSDEDADQFPSKQAAQPQQQPAQGAQRNGESFLSNTLSNVYETPDDYTPWVPKSAGYDKPMQHRWQQAVAEALNFMQLGWTAAAHTMFEGKTPRELNRFAGTRRERIPPQRERKSPGPRAAAAVEPEAPTFFQLRRKRMGTKGDALDWRQVHGKNWLQPVVSQGDCGSCYAISTVHMLTARNRIRHGDPNEPAFSVTFPLQCSEYNQGCNGGYGFLESKWAEDVGLVPERCAPFTDDPGACQALDECDLGDRRYRAVNHRYVGGFYGGGDHEQIKQELVTNGPMVLSFEPKEDFMYYKAGLYKSGGNKIHQEWEQVDHAVLLVGMGSDGGQPYWVMQNSWGTEWGEDGYFRMARGIDESGCESIAVAADVVQDSSNDVLDNFLASL